MGPPRDIASYEVTYYSAGWRLRVVVEAVEWVEGQPYFSHCNLEGELVPWDQPFDRESAARLAFEAQRYDGFHL